MSDAKGEERKRKSKKSRSRVKAEAEHEEKAADQTKLAEELKKIEEERKKELKKIEEERFKLIEENRKLQAELLAMRKELKKEDEKTQKIEKEIESVEKTIEEEKGAIGELANVKNDVLELKAKLEATQNALEDVTKWKAEITSKINEIADASKHAEHVPTLREQMEEMGRHISKKAEIDHIKAVEKGIKDVFEDLDDLGEELGYGEIMNVAKIPPQVLEAAYQTILDDLIKEMRKNFGSDESEKIIINVTEDLRQKTSGSELFRVSGANIELEDVVRSIEKGLISNKQVQMTYEELVKKLAEHIPYYKPKNLRALLKVKSLEFAVDKLRILIAEHEYVKKELNKLLRAQSLNLPKNSKNQKFNISDLLTNETSGGEESA